MTIRIAVLSDLHVDREAEPGSWDLARAAFGTASRADHVVVAGDLFDSAEAMRRDRGVVKRHLRKLGLWHPDRLTIVVGNHDIFEVGHRGSKARRLLDAARAVKGDPQENLETFSGWLDELVPDDDRHFEDLFPYRRQLPGVTLIAADSTAADTTSASQGYWLEEEDRGVRALVAASRGARILAVHNPPAFESGTLTWSERLQGYVDGYPEEDFDRIERLANEARIDLVVSGHYHSGLEDDEWSWRLGDATRVHVVGRTGGLHDETPVFGLLTVDSGSRCRWSTEQVEAGGP